MSLDELTKCEHCHAFYSDGTRHTCDHRDIVAAWKRLESFLGVFTYVTN